MKTRVRKTKSGVPTQVGKLSVSLLGAILLNGCMMINGGTDLNLKLDGNASYFLSVTPRLAADDLNRRIVIDDASLPSADIEVRTLDISFAGGALSCRYQDEASYSDCSSYTTFVWSSSDYMSNRRIEFRLEDPSGENETIDYVFDPASYYSFFPGLAAGLEFVTCDSIVDTSGSMAPRSMIDSLVAGGNSVICFVGGGSLNLDDGSWGTDGFSGFGPNVTLVSPHSDRVELLTGASRVVSNGSFGLRVVGLDLSSTGNMGIFNTGAVVVQDSGVVSSGSYTVGCGSTGNLILYGATIEGRSGEKGLNMAQSCRIDVIRSYVSSTSALAIDYYSDGGLSIRDSVVVGGSASLPAIEVSPGSSRASSTINAYNSTLATHSTYAVVDLNPSLSAGNTVTLNLDGVNIVRRGGGGSTAAGILVNATNVNIDGAAGASWFCHENGASDFDALLVENVTSGGTYDLTAQNNASSTASDQCSEEALSVL
jgi:hypothetical protein